MTADQTSSFDCNSDNVDVLVILTEIKGANFTHATSLDLNNNLRSRDPGVNHIVSVAGNSDLDVTVTVNNTGAFVDPNESGDNRATDVNGDIDIKITSSFVAVNGAEEIGAGQWSTLFTIIVTAL